MAGRPSGPVLAVFSTPLLQAPTVELHQHTWDVHIVKHGLLLANDLARVAAVVQSPRAIVTGAGTGRPGHLIYIGEARVRDDGSIGSPLTVVVNTIERYVCTAHPNASHKTIDRWRAIWVKP